MSLMTTDHQRLALETALQISQPSPTTPLSFSPSHHLRSGMLGIPLGYLRAHQQKMVLVHSFNNAFNHYYY